MVVLVQLHRDHACISRNGVVLTRIPITKVLLARMDGLRERSFRADDVAHSLELGDVVEQGAVR